MQVKATGEKLAAKKVPRHAIDDPGLQQQLLLERGADPNIGDHEGKITPLMYTKCAECQKLLLDAKAESCPEIKAVPGQSQANLGILPCFCCLAARNPKNSSLQTRIPIGAQWKSRRSCRHCA